MAWSADGNFSIAIRGNVGFHRCERVSHQRPSGPQEELTPHQGEVRICGVGRFARWQDRRSITSNQKGGYNNVGLLDIASKQDKWITDTQWEAQGGNFSPDGKTADVRGQC